MRDIHKIGLAGLGHIGRRHLSHIKALNLEAVTADPKVDAADAASLGSTTHYADFEEMLNAERPEAVVICLPSFMHRVSAELALQSGAHVLVEKPLALTTEDAEAIQSTAKACCRRVMAAHVCRFMGRNIMAHDIIAGGSLGKPIVMNAWRNNPTPMWSEGNWIGSRSASGGTVMDLQIHEIDLARWFLGPVREAALMQRQCVNHAGSGFYHAISSLSFQSGAAAVLEAGHLMPDCYVLTNGYRIVFEGGALEFSQRGYEPTMYMYEKGKVTDLTAQYKADWAGRNPYYDEMEHFINCLNTGAEFRISDEDARGAVETVIKLQNSEILKL